MKDLQRGIILLLKSAVTGEKVTLPEGFNFAEAIAVTIKNNTAALLYYGAENSGIKIPEEQLKALQMYLFKLIQFEAHQEFEINKVYAAFKEAQIDCLPLKGSVIKKLYPKPEMRHMGDVDLLVKTEQYEIIEKTMQALGFEFITESNHEYVWHKGLLHLELHKYLIPSYNKDYFKYFGTGWRLAAHDTENMYKMSDEDFLIYIFTHMAKHYRDSGIGVKHLLDIWVYLNAKPELDAKYLEKELKALQLFDFYESCLELFGVWFDGKPETAKTELMTEWIFSSGAYGTKENNELSMLLKEKLEENGKKDVGKKLLLRAFFPPYKDMKERYHILKALPFLLPFLWIWRLIYTLIFKFGSIRKKQDKINSLSQDNIDSYENALKFVGLEFNFGSKE